MAMRPVKGHLYRLLGKSNLWQLPAGRRHLFCSTPFRSNSNHKTHFQSSPSTQKSNDPYPIVVIPQAVQQNGPFMRFGAVFLFYCLGCLTVLTIPLVGSYVFSAYARGLLPGSNPENVRRMQVMLSETGEAETSSNMQATSDPNSETSWLEKVLVLERELARTRLQALEESTELRAAVSEQAEILADFERTSSTLLRYLLALICRPEAGTSVILDDALLVSRPITHESGERIDLTNAALIRMVDSAGKTELIILGVDLDKPDKRKDGDRRWPSHCYDLDEWLRDLAEHLHDEDAISHRGIGLYCVSKGIFFDVGKPGDSSLLVRYSRHNEPPGFPLRQMREVKTKQPPSSNISNAEATREADTV